ncbi:MAG: TolC family outer membrane protein [Gammaproteobacteria bacterium]|nr:TolC family outer membrane protein [Gammaproteobacteria bacterium]MDH5651844.1 TolC family outer membrane protein [Gammaproteobacteria bacterium]
MKTRHFLNSALAASLIFAAPQAGADDLQTIYQLALTNDPLFQAARSDFLANKELKSQAWAVLLPQISGSYLKSETEVNTSNNVMNPVGTTEVSGYSLSLTQTIYNQAQFSGLSQANATVARAVADFHFQEQNLILRVAKNYFDVLGAEDNLAFSQAEKKSIAHQLEQTTQRFNVGLTAITDVHEAQARYDQSVARDIAAENQLAISREILREMTGKEHGNLAVLQESSPLIAPQPADITQWVNTGLDNNYQLAAARKNLEASSAGVMKARAGHLPSLNLVAGMNNTTREGPIAYETDDTQISLQLSVPIFNGGLVSSRSTEAAHRHDQAKQLLEQQRRATERQVRNAYLSVLAKISQVKALKQALASSQTALKATRAGFKVGTRTTVDVLDSQRDLYRAKRDYALARYEYIMETLRLKQAAGTLTPEDLQHINAWLSMTRPAVSETP